MDIIYDYYPFYFQVVRLIITTKTRKMVKRTRCNANSDERCERPTTLMERKRERESGVGGGEKVRCDFTLDCIIMPIYMPMDRKDRWMTIEISEWESNGK